MYVFRDCQINYLMDVNDTKSSYVDNKNLMKSELVTEDSNQNSEMYEPWMFILFGIV